MNGMYLIVRRYESQYRTFEAPEKRPLYYAHPRKGKPAGSYRGLGREVLDCYDDLIGDLSPEQESLLEELEEERPFASLEEASLFLNAFEDAGVYEILWVAPAGEIYPGKGEFLGFDAVLPPEQEPFSAVSDLFFFPVWQGADPTGHAFDTEFEKLNQNGLFSNEEEADAFISHYEKMFETDRLLCYGIWSVKE